ncbi:MAG: cytochrome ubiquinol oxidase subunit I [Pseudomonadota bacterium]
MEALLLARIQFAANSTFHILFPTITIALGWLLLYFKLRFNRSGDERWMEAYGFGVKVFALSFALGVVSGVTMYFQFGTNWPGFMGAVGNIAGPLLAYEVLTAFFLEATFLGIMLLGRLRVSNGIHTLIASGLTVAFLITGLSSYRWLRKDRSESNRLALKTGVWLGAVLIALQARLLVAMTFSGWLATVAGWYTTEIGRQPWLVQGVLSPSEAVSSVPATAVATSALLYISLYLALVLAYVSVLIYLPVALMLCGLILRGVSFDFRVKAHANHKPTWNRLFWLGSLVASLSQGFMLGAYITGFGAGLAELAFSVVIALGVAAGYALLDGAWLIMKTDGALQAKAVRWSRYALVLTGAGVVAVSLATPWVSERIFDRWFTLPQLLWLPPIPLLTALLFLGCYRALARLARTTAGGEWQPFACAVGIFALSFLGLAYSLFPYLVVDRIDRWEAASAPESLMIILVGTLFTLPAILGYTVFAYRVFWGKATQLSYE